MQSRRSPCAGGWESPSSFGISPIDDATQNRGGLLHLLAARVDEIQIETTRQQLEDAHTQSFLKRKPVKLPYDHARRWVQLNLGCDTKEEFMDLVANGNVRTPYIPKQPEQYYTATREWVSWEHFLSDNNSRKVSNIKPPTGIFD